MPPLHRAGGSRGRGVRLRGRRGGAPVAPGCVGYSGFRKPTPELGALLNNHVRRPCRIRRPFIRLPSRRATSPASAAAGSSSRASPSGSRRAGCSCVTGPNGAGKSSLLRVLAGLLRPSAGSFHVEGAGKDDAVTHYLGHADALKPALTLRETLRFWGAVYRQQGRVPVDAISTNARGASGSAMRSTCRSASSPPASDAVPGLARLLLVAAAALAARRTDIRRSTATAKRCSATLMAEHLAAGGLDRRRHPPGSADPRAARSSTSATGA